MFHFYQTLSLLQTQIVVALICFCVIAPTTIRAQSTQGNNGGFDVTSVDGHPLSGSLADMVYDGQLPKDICHQGITEAEKQQTIPKDLLMAIALIEAGRWQGDGQPSLIWPWSLTVNGKGHFYETPELAINAAKVFVDHGIENMDIGCMQINFQYHRHAFDSLSEMFDPIYNTAYAAHFLQSLKDDLGTWSAATEGYHSRNPSVGIPYGKKVSDRWEELKQTRRQQHRENIALDTQQQLERQQQENARQAQVRAKQQATLEERKKAIEGTQASEWRRPQNYKQQQRDEATARARVLSGAKTPAPAFQHPSENKEVIYHTLEDNQTINTSKQWLLQKFDQWEYAEPELDGNNADRLP